MRWVALVLGAALAATYVSPAFGGPDLTARIKRVDQREARHYKALDRRIDAVYALLSDPTIRSTVQTAAMQQSGRFFSGTVSCPAGRLVGGGVDWGSSLLAQGWHVVASAPTLGATAWTATLAATDSLEGPSDIPRVYAVCATVS